MMIKIKLRALACGIIAFVLFTASVGYAAHDVVGIVNFRKVAAYSNDVFSDVSASAWYKENVASAYEYGLMSGNGNRTFSPTGEISIAETITVASRLYGIYHFGYSPLFEDVASGVAWYAPYVDYALEFGLIPQEFSRYNVPATRAEFAQILAYSVDLNDLQAINIVDDNAIPDVPMTAGYASAVYLLYRAGVLSGSDANGAFHPDSTITRAEAAAIITRIVDPTLRRNIDLTCDY